MKSAVKKLRIRVADDVGRSAELPMREGLDWAEISGGARVVGKDDLRNSVRAVIIESLNLVLPEHAMGSEPCC